MTARNDAYKCFERLGANKVVMGIIYSLTDEQLSALLLFVVDHGEVVAANLKAPPLPPGACTCPRTGFDTTCPAHGAFRE